MRHCLTDFREALAAGCRRLSGKCAARCLSRRHRFACEDVGCWYRLRLVLAAADHLDMRGARVPVDRLLLIGVCLILGIVSATRATK